MLSRSLPLLIAAAVAAALSSPSAASVLPSSSDWTNLNYDKQISLAGSVSHLVTAVTLLSNLAHRQVDGSQAAQLYYFSLAADEANAASWLRATLRSASSSPIAASGVVSADLRPVLEVTPLGPIDGDNETHLFSVPVPVAAFAQPHPPAGSAKDDALILTLEATLNHVSKPLPASIKQTESQFLVWTGDAAIRSPYPTNAGRIKIKSPNPRIVSFEPNGEGTTKAGSTVTYGPFTSVSPYAPRSTIQRGKVHYQHDQPVISLVDLQRTVEISHWGDNMAIEDRVWLRNDGAELKGHFSRIDHQMSSFYKQSAASHALTTLSMHLPPGARDAYFTDQIGNVSTSHFRPVAATSQPPVTPLNLLPPSRASLLELQPRFPLLGGWNYSFVVGFNLPLSKGGWLKTLPPSSSSSGKVYSAAIPFLTPITDVSIDYATLSIVLPEGAEPISISLPFPVDEQEEKMTKTYLDTRGRKTIVLRRKRNSEKMGQLVYVEYQLDTWRHLSKVIAVGSAAAMLFGLAVVARRVEYRIK